MRIAALLSCLLLYSCTPTPEAKESRKNGRLLTADEIHAHNENGFNVYECSYASLVLPKGTTLHPSIGNDCQMIQ